MPINSDLVGRGKRYRWNIIPGRPGLSNSGYYTEDVSSFLDHHLQPLAKAVKSYIKNTNDFLTRSPFSNNVALWHSFMCYECWRLINKYIAWCGSVCLKKTAGKPKRKIQYEAVSENNKIFTLGKKTFKYFAYGRKYNINMNINRIYGGSILTTSFSCASMSQVN